MCHDGREGHYEIILFWKAEVDSDGFTPTTPCSLVSRRDLGAFPLVMFRDNAPRGIAWSASSKFYLWLKKGAKWCIGYGPARIDVSLSKAMQLPTPTCAHIGSKPQQQKKAEGKKNRWLLLSVWVKNWLMCQLRVCLKSGHYADFDCSRSQLMCWLRQAVFSSFCAHLEFQVGFNLGPKSTFELTLAKFGHFFLSQLFFRFGWIRTLIRVEFGSSFIRIQVSHKCTLFTS